MLQTRNAAKEMEAGLPVGSQLFHILRERIIRNDLSPGTRISETEIANAYSVSRQPVREAFIKLAEAGLLDIRPQRGSFISKISVKGVIDARFVREAIEADIVKLLAEARDSGLISELNRQLTEQRKVRPEDYTAFMELDEQFHRTLAEAADKTYAWNVVEATRAQMDRVRYLSLVQFPMARIVDQHAAIVEAIAHADVQQAEENIRHHLREIITDLPGIAGQCPEFFEPV
ncbi:MAG: GntR family transcriptional regulator [Thiolinea sp.]